MGIKLGNRGQGSAEYVLLFGAIIVIAVAGLMIYYSYFQNVTGNGTADAKIRVQNLNNEDNKISFALYEMPTAGSPIKKAGADAQTITKSQTKEYPLGALSRNKNYLLTVTALENQRSASITLFIDNNPVSSLTITYPSTGSMSFAVPSKGGSGISVTQDINTVRSTIK